MGRGVWGMPGWARFLVAATTGAAGAVAAAAAGAWWRYGAAGFWTDLVRFAASAEFWWLGGRFWLVLAGGLASARAMAGMGGRRGPGAPLLGLFCGSAAAGVYSIFLHARLGLTGGAAAADAALLAAGAGVAGALANWLFERL